MRKLIPVVFTLIGLLAGLPVGYLAFADWGPPAADAPTIRQDYSVAPAATAPAAAPEPAPRPVEKLRKQPVEMAEISGRVTLEDGTALAGVEVRATPRITAQSEDASPAASVEDFARRRASQRELRRSALSGPDGLYRVERLDPALLYILEPELAGYSFRPDRMGRMTTFVPGRTVNFVAEPSVHVLCDVTLPDGQAPPLARITLSPAGGRATTWLWSPQFNSRDLPPGLYSVSATAGHHNEYLASDVQLQLEPGAQQRRLELRLEARSAIIGRVIGADGIQPILEVQLEGALDPRNALRRLTGRMNDRFEFLDLAPGEHTLVVRHVGVEIARKTVTLTGGIVETVLDMSEIDPANYIVLRISGPDGPIRAEVHLTLNVVYPGGTTSARVGSIRRVNGELWLARTDPMIPQENGHYRIGVRVDGMGTKEIDYEHDHINAVDVVFEQPGFLTVEVDGGATSRAPTSFTVGVVAAIVPAGVQRQDTAPRISGGANPGVHRFGPLMPGEYVVSLYTFGSESRPGAAVLSRVVRIGSGEHHETLAAPPLYNVTVEVPAEYRDSPPRIVPVGDREARQDSAAGSAEVQFRDLVAGEYRLRSVKYGEMRISVPEVAGRSVRYDPKPYDSLRLYPYGRASVDLGLRAGDCVVEIDGKPMTDRSERHRHLNEAIRKESTTWVILREGKRIPVTFDGRDWANAGLSGLSASAGE